MRRIFEVIGRFQTWLRSIASDPQQRFYTTHILIAMAIVTLNQEGVPSTRRNLIRLTGMSSSSVYRSTSQLEELGTLSQDDNGVWAWKLPVPNDIKNMKIAHDQSAILELKSFITETLSNLSTLIPNSDGRIEEVVEQIEKFEPSQPQTGVRTMFGDMVLGDDND